MRTSDRSRRQDVILVLTSVTLLLSSCAVPSAPTGGPSDSQPPSIIQTLPEDGSTSFSDPELRIVFSEYINEGSFARAFSITPEVDTQPRFSWRRQAVTVRFTSPLRTNTTYRVTIDRDLRDTNGVTLREPLVFAFSTGLQINRAAIRGRVRDGLTGRPEGNMDVFAYAANDLGDAPQDSASGQDLALVSSAALPERPLYRTETDDDGRFELTYLAEGLYYLIGVGDVNSNRLADERERVATPDRLFAVASESDADSISLTAFVFDKVPPTARRARALSSARIEIKYSEPVVISGPNAFAILDQWSLTDSTGRRNYQLRSIYVSANDAESIILVRDTTESWTGDSMLRLALAPVADSVGNQSTVQDLYFAPSNRPDTTDARILLWAPAPTGTDTVATLTADEWPTVSLSRESDPRDWLSVRDAATGNALDYEWEAPDGRSYRIIPNLKSPQDVFGLIASDALLSRRDRADSSTTKWFRKLRTGEVGEISAVVLANTPPTVQVYSSAAPNEGRNAALRGNNMFVRSALRPGTYGLRAFIDYDANGAWTSGTVWPYRTGEPIRWVVDSITVRARFETVLPDTIVINRD